MLIKVMLNPLNPSQQFYFDSISPVILTISSHVIITIIQPKMQIPDCTEHTAHINDLLSTFVHQNK